MNIKARLKNKSFWLGFIPAVLLAIQVILNVFGITFEYQVLEVNLVAVVNAVFALLAILGVAIDPTTVGISDSKLAMTYTEPKEDK